MPAGEDRSGRSEEHPPARAEVHRADEVDPDLVAAEDVPEPTTVWRAGHDRVATGPLRAQAHNVYNAEDEPLQPVRDRPPRETRGRPAGDAVGISDSTDRPAKTGGGVKPPPEPDDG